MSPHVRIADRLTTQSAEQLVATAATIITGLTGNAVFPSLPVDLKMTVGNLTPGTDYTFQVRAVGGWSLRSPS